MTKPSFSRDEKAEEPNHPFLFAEMFLKKSLESQRAFMEDINHSLHFDDIDAISDSLEELVRNLKNIDQEVKYCKENPTDILYGFEPKGRKPKFRKYAGNKHTYERVGKTKIW